MVTRIRNPAFMDVWLVMGGFKQAADTSAHATTAREYGFAKFWMRLVGDLVVKRGVFIAPGGQSHGTPMISTRDFSELMYAGAVYAGEENRLIEAGGPEWLTWRQIADIIGRKVGRAHSSPFNTRVDGETKSADGVAVLEADRKQFRSTSLRCKPSTALRSTQGHRRTWITKTMDRLRLSGLQLFEACSHMI